MLPQRRHAEILRCLAREGGSATVTTLAELLDASPATIRRDLICLERDGVLTRVHGGAMISPDAEPPFDYVAGEDVLDRDAVAKAAAALVNDGEVLLLDIGTMTHRLAAHLHGRSVTVMTSNLARLRGARQRPRGPADPARRRGAAELPLDGRFPHRGRAAPGPRQPAVHGDRRSARGRLGHGRHGGRGAAEARDAGRGADQVVLLADAAKFPGGGLARICGPDEVDVLVTNSDSCERTLNTMGEAGVEVVRA